jgi:hypothetical protein
MTEKSTNSSITEFVDFTFFKDTLPITNYFSFMENSIVFVRYM